MPFDLSDNPTVSIVSLALDASALRQQAIASNIAHANTQSATVASVSFEDQLGAARAQLASGRPLSASALHGVRPRVQWQSPSTGDGGIGSLDLESVRMTENTVRYEALLKGLGHHLAILSMAINEGKH